MESDISDPKPGLDLTWDWVPNERVGPIRFDAPIEGYLEELHLCKIIDDETLASELDHYEVPDAGIDICVEDDRVYWVRCERSLHFRGHNLIGVNEAVLESLLGAKPDQREEFDLSEEGDRASYEALDYDGLSLQVWMFEGQVESVSCSRDEEESD